MNGCVQTWCHSVAARNLCLIRMTADKSLLLVILCEIRKPTWSCDLEPHLQTCLKTLWLDSGYNAHKEALTVVDAANCVI